MNTPQLLDRNLATLKLLFVAILSLAMLIPLFMVRSIVSERQVMQADAQNTIASRWGGPQSIGGLVALASTPERFAPDKDARGRPAWRASVLGDLRIDTRLAAEHRRLGIYEVPVYTARMTITGRVDWQRLDAMQPGGSLILWLPLSDVRGVREILPLEFGGLELPASPLSVHDKVISGLQFVVSPEQRRALREAGESEYRLEINLAGSDALVFLPLADTTQVTLDADWPHPEFVGQYLPAERTISDDGTTASWQLLGLNRPFGDRWAVADMPFHELRKAGFGMRMETPVDRYQRSERSVKYGFLFISLTFFTLFLFEVLAGRPLHPVPYVLTGAALAIFYLVLLALSEYLPFAGAFGLAASLLVGIVTPYTGAVLGRRSRGLLVGMMMTVTYVLLYLLVSAQHAALLMGSLALLMAVAVLMYLTRSVDWYSYGARVSPDRQ